MRHSLPGGGIYGEGDNPERSTCPLRALPHVGHASGPGLGEPTPTKMSQVRHVCYMTGFERYTPGHSDVLQGSREAYEETLAGRGAADHGDGF